MVADTSRSTALEVKPVALLPQCWSAAPGTPQRRWRRAAPWYVSAKDFPVGGAMGAFPATASERGGALGAIAAMVSPVSDAIGAAPSPVMVFPGCGGAPVGAPDAGSMAAPFHGGGGFGFEATMYGSSADAVPSFLELMASVGPRNFGQEQSLHPPWKNSVEMWHHLSGKQSSLQPQTEGTHGYCKFFEGIEQEKYETMVDGDSNVIVSNEDDVAIESDDGLGDDEYSSDAEERTDGYSRHELMQNFTVGYSSAPEDSNTGIRFVDKRPMEADDAVEVRGASGDAGMVERIDEELMELDGCTNGRYQHDGARRSPHPLDSGEIKLLLATRTHGWNLQAAPWP